MGTDGDKKKKKKKKKSAKQKELDASESTTTDENHPHQHPQHHQMCTVHERRNSSEFDDTDTEVEAFRAALQCCTAQHCGCRMKLTPNIRSMIVDMCTSQQKQKADHSVIKSVMGC